MWRKRCHRLTTSNKVIAVAVAVAAVTTGLCIGAPVSESQDDDTNQSNKLVSVEDDEAGYEDEYVGEGRFLASFFFPLFPQYWPIDIGDNLNSLKSPKTVARFVYRDITSFAGIILTWGIVHAIMWNGKAVTEEDVPYPVRLLSYVIGSPNATAPAKPKSKLYQTNFGDGPELEERLTQESFTEFSPVVPFNLLADPNASFRNLALNTGFITFQLILWLLPTFFWPGEPLPVEPIFPLNLVGSKFPEDENAEAKTVELVEHVAQSPPVEVYNNLFCPQCVQRHLTAAAVGFFGKMWFWWFYSLLPDFPSFSIRPQFAKGLFEGNNGRSFAQHRREDPFGHIYSDVFDEIVNSIELSNRIFGTS